MTQDVNRGEFYSNRTGEHLLAVLAIVSKTDIAELRNKSLGKDEIIAALDSYPTNTLAMADKIVAKGGNKTDEGSARGGSDAEIVEQVVAEIGGLLSSHIETRVKPMEKAIVSQTSTLRKEIADVATEIAKRSDEAMQLLDKNITKALDDLRDSAVTKKDVIALVGKHAIDQTMLDSAIAARVNERLDTMSKGLKVDNVADAGAATEGKGGAKKTSAAVGGMVTLANRPRVVKVTDAKEIFGVQILGIDGKPIQVEVWNDPDHESINPDYVFNVEHLRVALLALSKKPCRNVFMFGDTGTGKTEFARQLSARLKRRLFRINFENGADSYNFIGGERAKDATTVYQYGTFSKGLKHPGALILLDELCFGKPGHLAALHATLEEAGKLTITETGERLEREEGVMIFAADNTNGTGDRSGRYDGLYTMNSALRRRFSYWLQFEYMAPDAEAALIDKRTGVGHKAAMAVVKLVTNMRTAARAGNLSDSPSLPHAIAFCEMVMAGKKIREAFEQTMVLSTSPEYAEKLQEIFVATINEDMMIKAIESGK